MRTITVTFFFEVNNIPKTELEIKFLTEVL